MLYLFELVPVLPRAHDAATAVCYCRSSQVKWLASGALLAVRTRYCVERLLDDSFLERYGQLECAAVQ